MEDNKKIDISVFPISIEIPIGYLVSFITMFNNKQIIAEGFPNITDTETLKNFFITFLISHIAFCVVTIIVDTVVRNIIIRSYTLHKKLRFFVTITWIGLGCLYAGVFYLVLHYTNQTLELSNNLRSLIMLIAIIQIFFVLLSLKTIKFKLPFNKNKLS